MADEVIIPSTDSDACTRVYANTLNINGGYYQAIISSYNTSTDDTFNTILANAVDIVWDPNTDKSYFRVKTSSSIDWPDYISIYQHATQDNEARVYEYIGETKVTVVDNTTYTCYVTDGCFLDEIMGGGAYYVMCPTTVSTEPGPVEPTGDGYLDYPGLIYYHGRLNSFIDDALSELLPKSEDGDIIYVYAGQVDNFSDLPTDASAGDVYNVVNADPDNKVKAGDNIAWTGTEWDDLSGYIDTSIYEKYADALADKEELLAQVNGMLDDYVSEESFDETMSNYVKEEDFDLERIDDPDIIALFENGGGITDPDAVVQVYGKIIWNDNNDSNADRPGDVFVRLFANGTQIDTTTVQGNDWVFNYTELPKYENGKLINYTISVDNLTYYDTTINEIEEYTFEITFTHYSLATVSLCCKITYEGDEIPVEFPFGDIIIYQDEKEYQSWTEVNHTSWSFVTNLPKYANPVDTYKYTIGCFLGYEAEAAITEVENSEYDIYYKVVITYGGGEVSEPLEPTNGTLDIEGNLDLSEDFKVNGNVIVTGDITGSGTLYATKTITCNGTTSATVNSGATLSECDISIDNGTITFTGEVTVSNDLISIQGTDVDGAHNNGTCIIDRDMEINITSTDRHSYYGFSTNANYASTTINRALNITVAGSGTSYGLYGSASSTVTIADTSRVNIIANSTARNAYGIYNNGSSVLMTINGVVIIETSGTGVTGAVTGSGTITVNGEPYEF